MAYETLGLQVMGTMLEDERTRLCGPMHAKLPDRIATRGGTTRSSVVLGGRKVAMDRPRAHYVDGTGEVELETWAAFADESLLDGLIFERMLMPAAEDKLFQLQEACRLGARVRERS